ncbi:hypothetical protein C8A00DRAFT_43272 [Chaetomidium leptoderma]|uniref:CNH domain-containing protein n=1 Tax=Chaetomidium leptoderma TaxID=669021 RepID=A0AAN6VMA6_9PEZI|nr:hypothetical protein C8A00DRAFT_43272 [Chaetomidium leptoderma]
MLSAFTARPIIELKQRDKSKIESILAYGDRVLVGLNTGSLRVYRVNDPLTPLDETPANSAPATQVDSDNPGSVAAVSKDEQPAPKSPATKPTDLLREIDKFSTRAIEQLARIREASTLVSLSNYAVSLHDINTFEPIEAPLLRTKNASTFAVTSNIVNDPATGIPEIISRLAVSVKRRLLLWSWRESELSPDVTEIVLAESIRSMTWANATKVVCGMNSGYVIVDVETGSAEDIVGPGAIGGAAGGQGRFGAVSAAGMGYMGLGGYMPKPLSAKLADGELLLAKDTNTLFVNDAGKALDKRQVPWQAAPESIGYSYPYILALQPPAKGSLEVRNPDTLSLLQTISLPGAAALHFPPPTSSLAHAGKGFHVLSDRAVWTMDTTDYDSQVEELVKAGKLDEAISIISMLEDALLKNKTETLREIKMQKAELLFRQKKYRESMDLFNEDEVNAPPERVLKLFPKIIAGELSGVEEEKQDESEQESSDGKATGEQEAKPDMAEVAFPPRGGGGFAKYLMGTRKLNPETASIASSKKAGGSDDDTASIKGKPQDDQSQQEKDLTAAVLELNSYLAGARARLQRVIDPVTGKLKPRKSESGSTTEEAFKTLLLSSPDEGDEQLEQEVQTTFKMVDTTLFRALMYSRPALASSLFRIPNFCDPDVVNERLVEHNRFNELVDFFYGKKLHRQALSLLRKFGAPDEPDDAAPALHGPQRTVMYLQGLPPEMIDVILEFSEWTLKRDPELGMEVFLADSENAETLPRDRVVAFLDGVDIGLEVRYLEHIITELNDLTPDFHNRLVELFIRQLAEKERGEEWDALMERLVRYLKEYKQQYSLGKARALIPKDDPPFYEAQAVVLSNMGQHRQALMIYVFKMKDYTKAEEYCNRIHKTQEDPQQPNPPAVAAAAEDRTQPATSEKPSIYHTLLSLYLKPPPEYSPNLEPALDLLSKHGSRLPATSTLSLVPDSLPVAQLESYFGGRMRSANSAVNETRVLAGLRKTALFASQSLLFLGDGGGGGGQGGGGGGGRNRRVVIGEERVCGVCHKRIGGIFLLWNLLAVVLLLLLVVDSLGPLGRRRARVPRLVLLHARRELPVDLVLERGHGLAELGEPARPTPRAPGSFSPLPASSPATTADQSRTRPIRQDLLSSDEPAPLNVVKTRNQQGQTGPSPTPIYTSFTSGSTNSSTSNLQNFSRPTVSTAVSAARSVTGPQSPNDSIPRSGPSPLTLPPTTSSPGTPTFSSRGVSHSRKHSQNAGLFEPTLPSTSTSNLSHVGLAHASPKPTPAPPHREMSASQIAAQAAVMQHQNQQHQNQQQQAQQAQQAQHARQRSQTAPGPVADDPPPVKRGSASMNMNPPMLSLTEASVPRDNAFGGQTYHNGLPGNHTLAATAAANLVFPRSAQTSPGIPTQPPAPPQQPPPPPPASEKPVKPEKSKVKLFSRQVKIGSKSDTKDKPLPSPGKVGHAFANLQRGNFSTTSLDSAAQSFYSLPNSSAATIRPADMPLEKEGKEKEKKHHFLSRQKQKLKDHDYHLPLSSAMSNSRPTDPSAPNSLYNFSLPPSPGPNSTSFKSALDLRHGGRALREKRKEEKSVDDASSSGVGSEWPGSSSVTSGSGTLASTIYSNEPFDSHKYGLNNMTHDDAWPFLKAKLLVVFEAEDLRLPVEDLNRVVTMHIQYCLARRSPNIIVDDLRELLSTGFSSLDQTLRKTPEDRLIPSLVELWMFTFTNVLPYMQAVFLPLDLEFSGHGPLMSSDQARDFWGGIPTATSTPEPSSSVTQKPGRSQSVSVSPASSVLEVRRFVLLAFRDIVILPRYDTLKAMFSRLSLEFLPQSLASMALASPPLPIPSPGFHNQGPQSMNQQLSNSPSDAYASTSLPTALGQYRPNTATSLDPSVASYNSNGSTLLGDSSGSGNRSRAISNVSFGSDSAAYPPLRPFTPSSLHALGAATHRDQNVEDSKQVTEMVGRMLQCMSVLASVGVARGGSGGGSGGGSARDNDAEEEGNRMVEELNKLLKLNWLGRGRTGRNRRGMSCDDDLRVLR